MKFLSLAVCLGVSTILAGSMASPAQATYSQCMNEVGYGKNRKILSTPIAERFYCSCISKLETGRDEHMYCLGIAHAAEWAEQYYSQRQARTSVNDLMREYLRSNPYSNFTIQPPNINF